MATYYKVQSAPAPTTGRSRWKGLFSGMKQGDWFIVPKNMQLEQGHQRILTLVKVCTNRTALPMVYAFK